MFDADLWSALIDGRACPVCRAAANADVAEGMTVADLPSGRVVLQQDADFPGYCILYYRRHVTELHELSEEERAALMEDIAAVARAIANVQRPAKLNYAILGNEAPHLHCHVIPRFPDDGYWGKPIWLRPADRKRALPPEQYHALGNAIQAAIGTAIAPNDPIT